jgi:hypothetical protein
MGSGSALPMVVLVALLAMCLTLVVLVFVHGGRP